MYTILCATDEEFLRISLMLCERNMGTGHVSHNSYK